VRSFCRVCTAVCGILVDVSGDEIVRVRGDKDHPFSHGYTCPKGRALPQVHHHPERLERPLLRVGGNLEPTTWDACLDDLATRLRAIIDRTGPKPSASSSGAASAWTRPATGWPRRYTPRSGHRRGSVP
jgi:anaerobic selenocysteine-containing dehydrogenase